MNHLLAIILQSLCLNYYSGVSSTDFTDITISPGDGSDLFITTPEDVNSFDTANVSEHRKHTHEKQIHTGHRIKVKIGDKIFLRETVLLLNEIPLEMVYDQEGNLFFTKVDLNSDVPLNAVMMKNGTSRFRKVKGVRNGQGTAVDRNGTVYFATKNGVHVYNKTESAAQFYALKGEDIFEISIDKNGTKYVISANDYSVHILNNNLTKEIYRRVGIADSISVDSFNTVYYLRHGFVYTLKNNDTQAKRIKELYKDSLSQIAYDSQDNVYIAYGGGMLFAPAGTEAFSKVKKIYGGPTSIAFDRYNNFALGYRKKIYKFYVMNSFDNTSSVA